MLLTSNTKPFKRLLYTPLYYILTLPWQIHSLFSTIDHFCTLSKTGKHLKSCTDYNIKILRSKRTFLLESNVIEKKSILSFPVSFYQCEFKVPKITLKTYLTFVLKKKQKINQWKKKQIFAPCQAIESGRQLLVLGNIVISLAYRGV